MQEREQWRSVPDGWWAVYTRHQHEKLAASALSVKGFSVFLPLYSCVHKWKDRRKALQVPLFPSYVFVRDALRRRLEVLATPGVRTILMVGKEPALVPEAELDALRRAIQSSSQIEPHTFLRSGDRVRVRSGPLEGIEGILTRWKKVYRLVLSVEILGKSAVLEVDVADVEPVSTHRATPFAPPREKTIFA